MNRYSVVCKIYDINYSQVTVMANTEEEATRIAQGITYGESIAVKNCVDSNRKREKSVSILNLLNTLYEEYNEIAGTIQAYKIDAIRRFFRFYIATGYMEEEYIRRIIE